MSGRLSVPYPARVARFQGRLPLRHRILNGMADEDRTHLADQIESNPLRDRVRSALSGIPAPVRKVLVSFAGAVLIVVGLSLVWLPGPFTLPFVIAGVVVLSTEFVWASSILRIGQEQSARLFANLRNPWLLAAALAGAVVLAVGLYTFMRPGWWN